MPVHLLVVVGVATWILAAARVTERYVRKASAEHHHYVHLLAICGFAAVLTAGFYSMATRPATTRDAAASDAVHAQFVFTSMGKYDDLDLSSKAVPAPEPSISATVQAIAAVWFLGMVVCLSRLGVRWIQLARLLARACPIEGKAARRNLDEIGADTGWHARIRFRLSDEIDCPMVWGPPLTTLIVPPSFLAEPQREIRMALLHELAHVQRRDTLTVLAVQLTCAIFWFHPLLWAVARRLEQLQEHCADRRVVAQGIRASDYGAYLVATARRSLGSALGDGALSILGRSPLGERLRVLLDPRRTERPSVGRGGTALLTFLLATIPICVLGFYATQASEDRPGWRETNWTYEKIDAVLNPLIVNKLEDLHIAGAAVTVVRGDQAIYTRGFGRAEVFEPRPVSPRRTIFRIGSVSKVVTGVAVMQLVERGLLALDADVNRYLKKFSVENKFAEPVRVRDLLTHTAGFDQLGYGRHASDAPSKRPLGEFLAENLVRIRPPGEVSCYDTYAITLAGYLVEVVSGQSYEEYLLEHIFAPLEMHRSGINVPPALNDDLAVGYEFLGEWDAQDWEFMNTDPASTVNSTVVEMGHFMTMLLDGGVFRGRRVLEEKSVKAMLTRQYANHPELPGFGLTFWEDRSFGVDAFSHGGSMTGYGCFLYLVPSQDLGVFVAYNQESGALASAVVGAVVEALLPEAIEKPESLPEWREAVDIERFTGTYASNMYNHTRPDRDGWRRRPFELTVDDEGRLLFEGRSCRPVGPLMFQRDDGLLLAFREDEERTVTHLFVQQTVFERLD